jgi:hypothetical protein
MQQAIAPEGLPLEDLHTVSELAKQHPNILPVPTLRWQVRHPEQNRLTACCVQIGKKLLNSKTPYRQWLAIHAGGAA